LHDNEDLKIHDYLFMIATWEINCAPPQVMTIDDPGSAPVHYTLSGPSVGLRLMQDFQSGVFPRATLPWEAP
jgi:hypothetical protein